MVRRGLWATRRRIDAGLHTIDASAVPAPGQDEERRTRMSNYDYVIVGAGSAGCLLAARLTEDRAARVLLIEAVGKDRSPKIKIPAAFAQQFQTKLDWNYESEPEPGCNGRRL